MASLYLNAENVTDFEEELQETWDQDLEREYSLVDVEYIDDTWTGVFVDNDKDNFFEWAEDFSGLQEKIEARQDEYHDLVDLDYIDDTWVAVFDYNMFSIQGSDYELAQDLTEFAEDTQKQLDSGYNITNIEYANGNWIGIYGNDLGTSTYATSDSLTGFKSDVAQARAEGFELVGVEYAEDTWVSVFQEYIYYGNIYHTTKYALAEDAEEFQSKFEARTEEGYDLIDYEQIDDIYLGIFQQPIETSSDVIEGSDAMWLALSMIDDVNSVSI